VPVCVIEDQYQFILGHQILWEGGDRDGIVSCIQTLQEHDPTLQELSLDKGFWSPTVYEELASTLALVALPKKGRRTAVEREREQAPAFAAARQQHPAIESAINRLEHHGLQRIRSFRPLTIQADLRAGSGSRSSPLISCVSDASPRQEKGASRTPASSPRRRARHTTPPLLMGGVRLLKHRDIPFAPITPTRAVWHQILGRFAPKNFFFPEKIRCARLEFTKRGFFDRH